MYDLRSHRTPHAGRRSAPAITVHPVLLEAFHRPLRRWAAALCLAGTGLAGMSSVLASTRLGTGQAVVFAVVAVGLAVLAVAVLKAARWALLVAAVAMGGQIAGVAGTVWELSAGVDGAKADELRRLGFDPTFGVILNLVYSALASLVFVWLVVRWRRLRHDARGR
jgi:hypothetical protein